MICRRIFARRVVLTGAALALGAAATATAASPAAAQQKVSQADAKYQATPKGEQHCDGCVNFQPPKACKFVQGDISPSGWVPAVLPRRPSPGRTGNFSCRDGGRAHLAANPLKIEALP